MRKSDETLVSVVVLEAGAVFPHWLRDYQSQTPNSVVAVQSQDESAAEFAARVCRRVSEIGAGLIHVGLLVSNGGLEDEQLRMRDQIGQCLVQAMLQRHHGELVIAGEAAFGEASRHALFSLAGVLCDEIRGGNVSVRVRFSGDAPASGVTHALSTPEVDELDHASFARP